jgi:hypothetical protein
VPHNEFLCTKKAYHNFEMRLKFKLIGPKDKANAGIQIRSRRIPNRHEVMGYQADIGQNFWGSLYDESRRNKVLAEFPVNAGQAVIKENDWNEYVIRCVDNRIQLWLNGYQTVDYEEPDESIEQMGVIGLEIHGGSPSEISYKEITIKELKDDVPFQVHVINEDSDYEAGGIFDVNRDGKLDIYCGGFWYEGPDWKKHFVRDVPGNGSYNDFAVIPHDVDGDGWIDVVNGSWGGKDVFWIRNPGQSGKPFKVFNIDKPGNLETVIAVDINRDGQLDFLPNTASSMQWYEYKRDPQKSSGVRWIKHTLLEDEETAGHGIGAGDVNADGKMDIITPKGWLEQTALSDDGWSWHPEFQLGIASVPVLTHDVDQDGDNDIIVGYGHDYGIYWLEQEILVNGKRNWIKHTIDDTWSQAHYLILADVDLDGQKELITGKRRYAHNGRDMGGEHPVCVYYYRCFSKNETWVRHVIHED